MLTFGTFVEHVTSRFLALEQEYSQWAHLPPLNQSHIFWLGEDEEFGRHVTEIFEDLRGDMSERIPMPFADISTVSFVKHFGLGETWTFDRIFENPPFLAQLLPNGNTSGLHSDQKFLVLRIQSQVLYEEKVVVPAPVLSWMVGYLGVKDGKMVVEIAPDIEVLRIAGKNPPHQRLLDETKLLFFQIAAISHPANYIVQVTPELTPKEERKFQAGRPRPAQKSRHFIVVDHTVLVRMRGQGGGEHASPVPHERRGHWRALSDRCRHAKLLGKDRVFVRPTVVGDPAWRGEKNFYEVLPDLNKAQMAEK